MANKSGHDAPEFDAANISAPNIGATVIGPQHAHSTHALWADTMGRVATRALQALLILAVVALLVYATLRLGPLIVPLLVALIVACALQPMLHWLKVRLPDPLAAAITLLVACVGIGGAVTYALGRLLAEMDGLKTAAMQGLQQAMNYLYNGPLPISADQIANARQSVVDFMTSPQFGLSAMAGVQNIVQVALECVLGLVMLFFLLKDGPRIWAFLISAFNPTLHDKLRYSGKQGADVLGGYLRGTALVALCDTVLIGGALWILDVPLALPLAILVFLGGFIPIIGATVSGIVAALVALVTVDLNAALWVIGVVIVVNQLESHVLAPVVMGKWMHLHSLAVLLALSAGAILGGIVGTFLAVPLTALAWAVLKAWNRPLDERAG